MTIWPFDCQPTTLVTLNSVSQDPIAGDDQAGWWGEFSYTGYYPVIAKQVPVIPFNWEEMSETGIDLVYVVIGCNNTSYSSLADLCTASKVYVQLSSGEFVEYTGAYTVSSYSFIDYAITDAFDCQIFCSRTFKYGMYVRCTSGFGGQGNLLGGLLYHLYPESDLARISDEVTGLSVPSTGKYFHDEQGISLTTYCGSATGTCDTAFGDSYSPTCSIVMPNETGGAVITGVNPMAYHVFGGCIDVIALHKGSTPLVLPICGAGSGATQVNFTFTW